MDTQDTLALGDYIAALKRRSLLGLGIALAVVLAAGVFTVTLPDVYTSTARFRLVTDRISESGADENEYADQYVFSLADKVLSGSYLQPLVRKVGLPPGFAGTEDEAVALVREGIVVRMTTQTVLDAGGRERTINTGFTVSHSSGSADYAGRVADALADSFVELGRAGQLTFATDRVKFFDGEAARINESIADFERRLAEFKSRNFNQLPDTVQANLAIRTRTETELEGIARELRNLQENRVFVEQQLQQAQTGPAADNLQQLEEDYARKAAVYAETHPDLVALRRQIESLRRGGPVLTESSSQAQLEAERATLAEVRQRYSDDHPDVRRLLRNIEMLETRVAAGEPVAGSTAGQTTVSVQLATQLNAIDTQIGGLRARSATLQARLAQLEAELGASPEVERDYLAITRGLDSARDLYNEMITRRMEAEVDVAAIRAGSADRFLLYARPGTAWQPSGPPRLGIIVVAGLLGLVLALAVIIIVEMLDSTIRGVRDVQRLLGTMPLATVPEIRPPGTSPWLISRWRRAKGRLREPAAAGSWVQRWVTRHASDPGTG
jgi:uncharacterized protein involved in exopolysaccharide biosynthesis